MIYCILLFNRSKIEVIHFSCPIETEKLQILKIGFGPKQFIK